MVNKMNLADTWLVNEITNELIRRHGFSPVKSHKAIEQSNFISLLAANPEDVHHESPSSWANTIARQMQMQS